LPCKVVVLRAACDIETSSPAVRRAATSNSFDSQTQEVIRVRQARRRGWHRACP